MKLSSENLEKLTYIHGKWYTNCVNGKTTNKSVRYEYRDSCLNCHQPFLSLLGKAKFCSNSCTSHGIHNPVYGKHRSEEIRDKISKTRIEKGVAKGKNNPAYGRILPAETIERIKSKNRGKNAFNYRRKFSKETRQKISEALIGEKHPNWKGGISLQPYCPLWRDAEWRKDIQDRDQEKFCWSPECLGLSNKQHLHHIDYNKKNCLPQNILTLCISCNMRANFNREKWTEMFENIMQTRGLA